LMSELGTNPFADATTRIHSAGRLATKKSS
jgi:hypothetical protein